uniref:ATP synthase peripheral stalk subunit F6, mitochondrial n=1 Tax=Callorhinus ursinus TaxID=34884 RepID=A0A3Q7P3Z7_CALUR|nr:ATP synthase-coupling factor 6, mitochondrial-like [Callorhinus ursinus]
MAGITLMLQRLLRFSSLIRSAVSVHLRSNTGVILAFTAVAFNKELGPVQKLIVDKIREYRTKLRASGGPFDTGPEHQQDLGRELLKLKQTYGKTDMNTFLDFTFENPKFEVIEKPQSWKTHAHSPRRTPTPSAPTPVASILTLHTTLPNTVEATALLPPQPREF